MSMQEASSVHPLMMQADASNNTSNLDANEEQTSGEHDAQGKIRLFDIAGIDSEKKKGKLLSPIATYRTDRYRLASPHGYKI